MFKKIIIFFIFTLFSINILAEVKSKLASTEVIDFQPTKVVLTKEKLGSCWTNSIAIARSDAWRCAVANAIYDPCFTTKTPDILVCNADPSKKNAGFLLRLKQPLPKSHKIKLQKNSAWIIELQDGLLCQPYTGTLPIIRNGSKTKAVQYGCANSKNNSFIGLLDGSIKRGKVWCAQRVIYTTVGSRLKKLEIQKVEIKRVWR